METETRDDATRLDNTHYLPPEEYARAIRILRDFTTRALFWLSQSTPGSLKDQTIGQFIARGTVCLDSIWLLWQEGNYEDCWILHRALTDRLFHLMHLADRDEFAEFEAWSFQQQWRQRSRILNNSALAAKLSPERLANARELQREQQARFQSEPKSTWRRPRAEDVAERADLDFVYAISYSAPSMEVHPMANDGEAAFVRLMGHEQTPDVDEIGVLHNSVAAQLVLFNRGRVASSVLWRAFVEKFSDDVGSWLASGSYEYVLSYQKSLAFDPETPWCAPKPTEPNARA